MTDKLSVQLIALRKTLGEELLKARLAGDGASEQVLLSQIRDVRIALGETEANAQEIGEAVTLDERIKCIILSLLRYRNPDKSICPSEVARVVESPDKWRGSMPATRAVATRLAKENVLLITSGEQVLDPDDPGKGPVRLRRGSSFC